MSFAHLNPFRMLAAFVAALVVLALAGAAPPALAQTYTVLYNVPGGLGISNPDGQAIAQGRDGNLYTTSILGGALSYGTFFNFTPSGTTTLLANISYFVDSGVTLGTDGNFYGTNQNGGTNGYGEVYKVTSAGAVTPLYNFTGGTDGADPQAPPIQATNGIFYGTTCSVFVPNSTVYSITSGGVFKTIHTFTGTDGQDVRAALVQGTDGNLYGGTVSGGTSTLWGVIFKMSPSGTVTVLHNFVGTDGAQVFVPLIQANDGNFYGVTNRGGSSGNGVFFKITSSGAYTVLFNFPLTPPSTPVVQATDGNFYGGTASGGSGIYGTLYQLTKAGTFTVLHTFDNTDGNNPQTPLKQHTNGVLYGTTYSGGSSTMCEGGPCGVVFSLDMGLKSFASLSATSGKEGAKIGIFGQRFGSTSVVKFGGTQATTVARSGMTYLTATVPAVALTGFVTVTTGTTTLTSSKTFKVLPTITSFSPASGPVGTPVTITGTGLEQTTVVKFGSVKATSFTVVSDTEVTTDVPTGAVTAKIAVATKGGSATSTTTFTVN